MNDNDAFVILGGPNDRIKFASDAIILGLKLQLKVFLLKPVQQLLTARQYS